MNSLAGPDEGSRVELPVKGPSPPAPCNLLAVVVVVLVLVVEEGRAEPVELLPTATGDATGLIQANPGEMKSFKSVNIKAADN